MHSTDLNAELLIKLEEVDYPYVIKNAAGDAIGVYLPIDSYRGMQQALAKHVSCPVSAEELARLPQPVQRRPLPMPNRLGLFDGDDGDGNHQRRGNLLDKD